MAKSTLVNMKLPPPEKDKPYPEPALVEGPRYPYGLSIRLEGEALDKLGITTLPEVGTEIMVHAKAKVTSVREEEYAGEGGSSSHKCVELQITDLALEGLEAETVDASAKLYAKG